MTIYDADFALELQAQENAEKAQVTAVQEPIAEVQEEPEVQQEEMQEEQVQEESRPQETESDADRNWRAVREELQRIKEENAYLRGKSEKEPQKEVKEDPLSNLDDDEYLSKGQVKKYLEQMDSNNQKRLAEMKLSSDEELMRMQFNDYDEVINEYFLPLMKQNPYFEVQLRSAPNAAAYAYKVGKGALMEKQMLQPKPAPEEPKAANAQRIVSNSRKPATLSSARGGSPKMSQADYYASMSEADFQALMKKNLEEV